MNSNELINSMADMILVMLSQCEEHEEDIPQICCQVIPFFNEIFNTILPDDDLRKVKLATTTYWGALAKCSEFLNKKSEETQQISEFLPFLVQKSIMFEAYDNIADFYIQLISDCNSYSSAGNAFLNSLKMVFQVKDVKEAFLFGNGIIISCTNCIDGRSSTLTRFIFDFIKENAESLADEQYYTVMLKFIAIISSSLHKITFEDSKLFTDIICELIKKNPKHLSTAIEVGLFPSIGKYLLLIQDISDSDVSLLAKFSRFSTDITKVVPPAIVSMIDTAINEECSLYLHRNIITEVKKYTKEKENALISILFVSQLAFSTDIYDFVSIELLADMVHYLIYDRSVDCLSTTPGLIRFCNKEVATKIDISPLLNVFVLLADNFSPFAGSFFFPFISELNNDETIQIFNKYSDILTLITTNVLLLPEKAEKVELLMKFVSVYDKLNRYEQSMASLIMVFQSEDGLVLIPDILNRFFNNNQHADSFLELLISVAKNSVTFHSYLRQSTLNDVLKLYKIGLITNVHAMDYISSISENNYLYEYNDLISTYLPTVDYFGATPKMLAHFAFGLPCESEEPIVTNLLFPCVLHKAERVEIHHEFDLLLVALRTEFPTLEENFYLPQVSGYFVTTEIVEMLIKSPQLFYEASKERENKDSYFVIDKYGGNFSLTNVESCNEIGLWITVREDNANCLLILYKGIRISVQDNSLIINTKTVKKIEKDKAFMIYLKTSSKDCEVFIDTTSEGTFKTMETDTKIGETNSCNFVIHSIRFFESKFHEDYQARMYKAGKNATYSMNELYHLSPTLYISEEGEVSRPKPVIGNSHPITDRSLAAFIRNTLDGFDYIMRIIYEENDTESCYYIKSLINFQKRKETNWTNKEFALRMSSIMPTHNVGDDIIDEIIGIFLENGKLDWEALSLFICDYSLFSSNHIHIIIEKLCKFAAMNFEFPEYIVNFLLFNLLLNNENSEAIGKIVKLVKKCSQSKIMYLSCYPYSRNGLLSEKSIYSIVDNDINAAHLFHTLPPSASIKIAMLLSGDNLPLKLRKQIIAAMFINCGRKEAWDSAISICTNTMNQDVDSPDLSKFDPALLTDFLPMIAGLAYGSATAENAWSIRCMLLLNQLTRIYADNIDKNVLNELRLWLRVIIGMGCSFDSFVSPIPNREHCMIVYGVNPQVPSQTKSVYTRRGSNEQSVGLIRHSSLNSAKLNATNIPKISTLRTRPKIPSSNNVPKACSPLPTSIGSQKKKNPPSPLPSPLFRDTRKFMGIKQFPTALELHHYNPESVKNSEAIPQITENSTDTNDKLQNESTNELNIEVTKETVSGIFKDVNEIIKNDVLIYPGVPFMPIKHKASDEDKELVPLCNSFPELLQNFIKIYGGGGKKNPEVQETVARFAATLCITNTAIEEMMYTPLYSFPQDQFAESYSLITKEILMQKPSKSLFTKICQCVLGGWFKEYTVDIISKLAEVARNDRSYVSETFLNLLVFMPRNILFIGQVSNLASWAYDTDVFRSKIGLVVSLAETCQLIPMMKPIMEKLEADNETWRKMLNTEDEQPLFSLNASTEAKSYCMSQSMKMKEKCIQETANSLTENRKFVKDGDSFISTITINNTKAHAKSRIIRESFFQCMDAFHQVFLRDRELLIWRIYKMKVKRTERETISLLSDSTLPTRRVDPSPFSYIVPQFGRSSITDIFETLYGEENKMVSNFNDAYTMKVPNPIADIADDVHLSFAWSFQTEPKTLQMVAEYFFNGSKPIGLQLNGSVLFGIDYLQGAFLVIKGLKLIFIEGLVVSKNGYSFSEQQEKSLPGRFYAEAITAGYFGSPLTFCGHIGFTIDLRELMAVKRHQWLQRPISCLLQFSRGQSFCVILKEETINGFVQHMEECVNAFLSQAPPLTLSVMSPLTSAHMLNTPLKDITNLWVNGSISSFFYLSLLNVFGGRSYADHTQYFVLPWIISDYTCGDFDETTTRDLTKPMGQMGGERMKAYDKMYEESDNSYFYGTHFMHFGVVLYFTFRIDPFCLFSLHLNNGWDHPNRIFVSVDDSWNSASHNTPADVKELIPAIYTVPEILRAKIPLQCQERNAEVVDLPKWAKSGRDFVVKMQEKLETNEVSENLCYWIDLIFGEKSRGEKAVQAKNVFHPLTYDDNETIDDDIQREANETCIINFGQCCKQLFTKGHPQQKRPYQWNCLPTAIAFTQQVYVDPCYIAYAVDRDIIGGSKNSILLCKSVYEYTYPMLGPVKMPSKMKNVTNIAPTDDGLHIACCTSDRRLLVSRLQYSKGKLSNIALIDSIYVGEKMSFVIISAQHFIACACYGKKMIIYDYGTRNILHVLDTEYEDTFGFVDDSSGLIVLGCATGIEVFTISGAKQISKCFNGITCIASSHLPISNDERYICVGTKSGSVLLMDMETLSVINEIKFNSPINSVHVHESSIRIAVTTNNGIFSVEGLNINQPLKKNYAFTCAVCGERLIKSCEVCSECSRFVCAKCKTECKHFV